MTMTDPIADFLTQIRNAITATHERVDMPSSKLKVELARILEQEGYIEGYSVEDARVGKLLSIRLKYTEERDPVISGRERVSKPGRRTYVNSDEVPRVLGGMGTAIISTSSGLMTGHEARRQRVGGELLAQVW
jgi:small subunit ribosomal protein S8